MASDGQSLLASDLGHLRQVLHAERDVLDVHINRIREALLRNHRDQLLAHFLDPVLSRAVGWDRVACQQRDGGGLWDLQGQLPGDPGLSQLGVHRQSVAGLELEGRGPVREHLGDDRPAERHHVFL